MVKKLFYRKENPTFAPLPENVVAQLNAVSTATISYQLAADGAWLELA